MNLELTRVDVWATEIDDKPGALALKLRAIADYGTDLDCVIARREHDRPGKGVMYISPLNSRPAVENADQVGLRHNAGTPTLKIEGPNQAGMGATLSKAIGDAGVNMHGLSAMKVGHHFVCYIGFDSESDLETAEAALKKLTVHDWRFWRRPEPAGV